MGTYVLVGGSWLGGWAWREVADDLRRLGHAVYTPSLTGLGDRAHLDGPHVGLDTHVQDLVTLLRAEELHEVVLVGHSSGGFPVTAAAAEEPERIARLVYIDANVPRKDGEAHADEFHPDQLRHFEEAVAAFDGRRAPLPDDEVLVHYLGADDLGEEGLARLRRLASPHPFATATERLSTPLDAAADIPRTFVRCTRVWGPDPWWVEQAEATPGWRWHRLDSGHWPMLSLSGPLAALLAQEAPTAPRTVPDSDIDRYLGLFNADERTQLETMLDFYRDAMVRKLDGLESADLWWSPLGSGTSLLGLIKHLTDVEHGWFVEVLAGEEITWTGEETEESEAAHAVAWTRQDGDTPERVAESYRQACDRSRTLAAGRGLEDLGRHPQAQPTLRWIYLHLIEETARHAGHADILRELLDGAVGE